LLIGLIAATIVDLGVAALLIAVSGFIVGSGSDSMQAGALGAFGLIAAIAVCLAAPVAGFILRARDRAQAGLIFASLPALGAALALLFPAH
jgi:hypothetical protein